MHWGHTKGRIGDALGMHWGRFWNTFGSLWGHSGDTLGTLWGLRGDSLEMLWGRFGDAILKLCSACRLEGFSVLFFYTTSKCSSFKGQSLSRKKNSKTPP